MKFADNKLAAITELLDQITTQINCYNNMTHFTYLAAITKYH